MSSTIPSTSRASRSAHSPTTRVGAPLHREGLSGDRPGAGRRRFAASIRSTGRRSTGRPAGTADDARGDGGRARQPGLVDADLGAEGEFAHLHGQPQGRRRGMGGLHPRACQGPPARLASRAPAGQAHHQQGGRGADHRPLAPRARGAVACSASARAAPQVADALQISENTLRAYINSARHKLGAANVTHAVALATARGHDRADRGVAEILRAAHARELLQRLALNPTRIRPRGNSSSTRRGGRGRRFRRPRATARRGCGRRCGAGGP